MVNSDRAVNKVRRNLVQTQIDPVAAERDH